MRPSLCLLAACLLPGLALAAPWGPDSPHYRYPADFRITLNRTLEVPPESATVRLQFGGVVPRNGVQEVEPHCIFELDTVRDSAQPVRPQAMRVTSVRRSVSSFSGMPMGLFASPLDFMRAGPDDDGLPSQVYYKTEFRLRAELQPEIRSLTCQSNQMSAGITIMRHLTLPEIRQALGDWFSLDLP